MPTRAVNGFAVSPTRAGARLRRKSGELVVLLERHYPDARCSLDFSTPLELLVATILSAQCTDERVNMVTPLLFTTYRSAAAYAAADPGVLERAIRSTGFFRVKAANIIAATARILARHGGEIPRTMEELTALAGVGRKTANVILGNAFGVPGIVVDTHVGRVAVRLGLAKTSDAVKIERELMPLVPRERWVRFSHQVIAHGRALCRAQRPLCDGCFIDAALCPSRGGGRRLASIP